MLPSSTSAARKWIGRGTALTVVIAIGLLSASCAEQPRTLRVWSDVPQMAIVAELYNRTQQDVRIELSNYEKPYAAHLDGLDAPDIIISRDLGGARLADHFVSLESLVSDGDARFYPGLLALGVHDEDQLLIPLSFDAPGIMFPRDAAPRSVDPFAIGDEDLQTYAAVFNESSGDRFRAMGFLPRLDPRFILAQARHNGVALRGEDTLRWDPVGLRTSMVTIGDWIDRINGSVASEDEYKQRYLHDPVKRLMEDGRILFAFTTVSEFFTGDDRSWLEFRWYMNDHRIHLWGAPVMAGVTVESSIRQGAISFLRELTSPGPQESVMGESERMSGTGFGFLGGLSSLPEINRGALVDSYRDLEGMIPSSTRWSFGPRLPRDWNSLRDEAVLPVMRRYYVENIDLEETLQSEVERWFRQQTD